MMCKPDLNRYNVYIDWRPRERLEPAFRAAGFEAVETRGSRKVLMRSTVDERDRG
jgi:hypothetical protein